MTAPLHGIGSTVAGAAEYEDDERVLAGLPAVALRAIVLDPTEDPVLQPRTREQHAAHFSSLLDHRLIASGHDQLLDEPTEVARAVIDLHAAVASHPTRR